MGNWVRVFVPMSDAKALLDEAMRLKPPVGLAWWYRQYAKHDQVLSALEAEARAAKRGLWSDPRAVPPWEWRKVRRLSLPDLSPSLLDGLLEIFYGLRA